MEESKKITLFVSFIVWTGIILVPINMFFICPHLPETWGTGKNTTLDFFTEACLFFFIEIGSFLILGFLAYFLLYPIVLFIRKSSEKTKENLFFIAIITIIPLGVAIILVLTIYCVETARQKHIKDVRNSLSQPLFKPQEIVYHAQDPQRSKGIVVKCFFANKKEIPSNPKKYNLILENYEKEDLLPYFYEVRFINPQGKESIEKMSLFQTSLFAEFELKKDNFINYKEINNSN